MVIKRTINYIVSRPMALFIKVQQSSGLLLLLCTIVSLKLANSSWGSGYLALWEAKIGGHISPAFVVNDLLMAVFFLLIGIEMRRELAFGELRGARKAGLPVMAAAGGMVIPALIFFMCNMGSQTQAGWGIPMATDIAFSLAVLNMAGKYLSPAIKVLLTALAVVDDLGAIVVIAVFYSSHLQWLYLVGVVLVFALLKLLNQKLKTSVAPYMLGGAMMWWLMHHSGIHATLAGVLTAFAFPLSNKEESPMSKLEKALHRPVNYIIMPLFALANTAIVFSSDSIAWPLTPLFLGILAGLCIGKPLGIVFFVYIGKWTRLIALPNNIAFRQMMGIGLLGGIGFTMSVFVTLLAFPSSPAFQDEAKLAIILASVISGLVGWAVLKRWKIES